MKKMSRFYVCIVYIPQTDFICRGSGGFGREAGGGMQMPGQQLAAERVHRFVVKTNTKSMLASKTQYFLMVFDENVDFS